MRKGDWKGGIFWCWEAHAPCPKGEREGECWSQYLEGLGAWLVQASQAQNSDGMSWRPSADVTRIQPVIKRAERFIRECSPLP